MLAATLDAVPGLRTDCRSRPRRRPDKLHANKAYDHSPLPAGMPGVDHHAAHRLPRRQEQLLARPLRTSGRLALACLLETARKPTVRLWAQGAAFETKDALKGRGFRWSGPRRCWYMDCDEDQLEIERTFLSETVYRRAVTDLPVDRMTARDRFSARTNPETPIV